MQSSVSANIITQLGYLQNYAGKGHFLTRERFADTRGLALPAAATKGPRCCPAGAPRVRGSACRAPASRGPRSSPPTPGPPSRAWGPHAPFSPGLSLFPLHFPPWISSFSPIFPACRQHSRHAPAAHSAHALLIANFEQSPPGFTEREAIKRVRAFVLLLLGDVHSFAAERAPWERRAHERRRLRGRGSSGAATAKRSGRCAQSSGRDRPDQRSASGEGPGGAPEAGSSCAGVVPADCRRGTAV